MLDRYFIRPTTIDRIRASWIGDAIDRYVGWLTDRNCAARTVFFRVPVLVRFGESGSLRGNPAQGTCRNFPLTSSPSWRTG